MFKTYLKVSHGAQAALGQPYSPLQTEEVKDITTQSCASH